MEKEELKEITLKISKGVFSKTTDLLLYTIFLLGASIGKSPTSRGVYQMFSQADKDFNQFNSETLRQAFGYLKRKGLIMVLKDELFYKPIISMTGLEKLKAHLPRYDEKRVWDKRIYLVTYDIPEKARNAREFLRDFVLRRLGAGVLQESVYLTFYNPREILKKVVKEKKIPGSIIVSDLGKDGSVGEEDLTTLIRRIYHLDKLEERYQGFLDRYQNQKGEISLLGLSFDFYSILEDDPQIPFELLPRDWIGEKAYSLFKNLLKNVKKQ